MVVLQKPCQNRKLFLHGKAHISVSRLKIDRTQFQLRNKNIISVILKEFGVQDCLTKASNFLFVSFTSFKNICWFNEQTKL